MKPVSALPHEFAKETRAPQLGRGATALLIGTVGLSVFWWLNVTSSLGDVGNIAISLACRAIMVLGVGWLAPRGGRYGWITRVALVLFPAMLLVDLIWLFSGDEPSGARVMRGASTVVDIVAFVCAITVVHDVLTSLRRPLRAYRSVGIATTLMVAAPQLLPTKWFVWMGALDIWLEDNVGQTAMLAGFWFMGAAPVVVLAVGAAAVVRGVRRDA